MENTRAEYLFKRYFNQTETAEERDELMEWIDKEENEQKIKALMHKVWNEFRESEKIFTGKKSEEILHHVLEGHLKAADSQKLMRIRRHRVVWLRAAAAAVLALLLTGGYFWHTATSPGTKTAVSHLQMKNDVAPGGNKATLTLANGKTIILDSVRSGQLANQGNSKVVKVNNGQLEYEAQDSKVKEGSRVSFNTLTTPRGGEYQLLLPDGSKVWLNASSSIRFPTAFTGGERKVGITGEAYFEIARNPEKPFIVQTNRMNVTVLGTHFNVNTYQDEGAMKVTLVDGKVKVTTDDGRGAILKPGEQAQVNGTAQIKLVENADVEESVAWKNGLFQFDGDDMGMIMRKVSRWYDVKVSYKNGIPPGHFTGVISRNTDLSEVLKMLELSGVGFNVEGKNLIVL